MEKDVKQAFDDMGRENAAFHEETRRHFAIAADGLKYEIRLVAEGLQHVDQRVGRTETRLDSIETKVDALETKVDAIEVRVTSVEAKVDIIDRKLDAMTDLRPRIEQLESSGAR